MNNATLFNADRTTHLKIVVISLVASIAIIVVGIVASKTSTPDNPSRIETAGPPMNAGKTTTVRTETAPIP
jgi:hypothetical protein